MSTSDRRADGSHSYTHGHSDAVLRSHRARTVGNSAAYLIPYLEDGQRILDVGCGPATITADLARMLPGSEVVGLEPEPSAFSSLQERPANLDLRVGSLEDHDLTSRSFDVVHAHQVLQHVPDPTASLRRMAGLLKEDGLIAVRDVDYASMTWAPDNPGLDTWLNEYRTIHRGDGNDPDAGRRLRSWAMDAGLDIVSSGSSSWTFTSVDERQFWGEMWAARCVDPRSRLARKLAARGNDTAALADAWLAWAADPRGWFAMLHGELIAKLPAGTLVG